ncbi:hypothetical protein [Streptomyces sp. SID8499]|uniref:hypothetical protein n=1 Tax=Streptomyces sp. SID8499 TaxID=2706106 RepID=UPI0013C5EF89|nr:hypothetical protein [Streptomyces sp. SID8499]NED36686.1 hypothetical protein [Streptomyces sp. SID8499]
MSVTPADRLVNAVIKKVKDSGLLWSGVLMGTVSAVGTNGTITVTRGTDTYPSVRLLASVAPSVGDSVEIMRTLGGWVCLGVVQSATPVWTSITPASGYTNNGNSNGTLQYRVFSLAGSRHVEWCGGVSWATNGSPPNSGVICNVPTNARPSSIRSLACAAGSEVVKVDFRDDGNVQIVQRNSSTLTTWVSLNGCIYRID